MSVMILHQRRHLILAMDKSIGIKMTQYGKLRYS